MTPAEPPARCLLVDVSTEEQDLLDELPGYERSSSAAMADRPGPDQQPVDLVLIGTLAASPVATVQRAHLLLPDTPVAVLAHDPDAVRRELSFAPGVPLDVLVLAPGDDDVLGRLADLRAAGIVRREHRAVLAAVARSTDEAPPAAPANVTAVGALLEHAPLAVLVTDEAGELLGWNRRAEGLFDLETPMSGRPVDDVVPGAGQLVRKFSPPVGQVASPRSAGPVLHLRMADRVDVELSAVSSQTDQGRAVVLLLAVDVTAQRQAERDRDRLVAQLQLLGRVSESLMTSLDAAETRSRLADVLVPSFADWTSIQLWDDREQPSGVLIRHSDTELAAMARHVAELKFRRGVISEPSRRAAAGETVLLPELDAAALDRQVADAELRAVIRQLGVASMIAVPLAGRTDVLGSLLLVNGPGSDTFAEADLALAVEIGRRAGIALDNARLYAGQRHLATELQQSLLTAPPALGYADIAVRYVAAAEQAQVGGDWYDAFCRRDGDLMLVIGDVAGHDTRAAAAMGQLRGLVRGICFTSAAAPSRLLTSVDEAIVGLELDTMATAVLAQLVPPVRRDGSPGLRMRWSNAGHPPPVLVDASGRATLLDARRRKADLLLGVDASAGRTTHEVLIPTGATLFFYTDGLIERRGEDFDEGLARLTTAVAGQASADVETLCDAVLEEMIPDGGEDDVAVVAVRSA